MINRAFGTELTVRTFCSLKEMKEFCSGLLLPSSGHPWSRPTACLTARDRLSIAGSLFLFRKTLPASTPSIPDYLDKMSKPAPDPPSGFMEFISKEMSEMFPVGWDSKYGSAVAGTVVRTSACLEATRKVGGARGLLVEGWESRAEFCRSVLDKYAKPIETRGVSLSRAMVARCDGKDRIVTVNSVDMTYLTPYHTTMYDHISGMDWCLRGEARAASFSDFLRRKGEVFVSGDYESATDNLNLDVARHILNLINRSCSRVPLWIRDLASDTLGGLIEGPERTVRVRRGQLMGNALSFPLLCLQNYLAFRFLHPRRVPVKINGDDIVFRTTQGEFEKWSAGVTACGLTLSVGKTAVSKHWFSLNSTFFISGTVRVREAPVIRSTCFFKPVEDFGSIAGRLATLKSFGNHNRRRILTEFLLGRLRPAIMASQVSVTRGLGAFVSKRSLFGANLAERESFYLSLDKSFDKLKGKVNVGYLSHELPEGWKRVKSTEPVCESDQREFFRELVEATWRPLKAVHGEEKVETFTSRFVTYPCKWARVLKLSNREVYRRKTNFKLPKKERGTYRWVRRECVVGSAVEEDYSFGDEFEMCGGGCLNLETLEFYDFSPPGRDAFPSVYHSILD
uniref:RNA-dependent RNA polymerase n=1 Tax=Erysiphe necator associated ourmia-like virus 117 TaxID=2741777 RepID=A0A8E3YNJ7_9VIRU|nr:RNA-dependent RNA polymerase [Erysiphe necator associated ourmia-like virus 117]